MDIAHRHHAERLGVLSHKLDSIGPEPGTNEPIRLERADVHFLGKFVAAVERRAEGKMLLTGKLEGAHYAAMKELLAELEAGAK